MTLLNQIKFAAVAASIASVSVLTSSPAEAVTFNIGDRFTANAQFTLVGDSSTSLFFDFLDVDGNTGGPGNFGIHNSTAVGSFVDYTTGSQVRSEYTIQNVDFGSATQVANFLTFNDGPGGLSEWSMDLTSINVVSDTALSNMRFVDIYATALFRGDNVAQGDGGLQGTIRFNQESQTAQFDFEVTSVPEPMGVIGAGVAFGMMAGLLKRQPSKKES
ncbi:PEP-CTERM sorting domain-containing protein [Limnospira fusiformis]|uniref:PEP-CTERM sorting domain-containing protein n=1 Tax=Limnospira fusiformis TaxID=54297 RepID=UPI001449C06E|nr:PEP-CTERM sorting domain-containing protein [Limnospira fusiformis SAG 85.79]